jgi:hypothetical protein
MMGGVSPETCWAIKKHWNNKFYYTVVSCWFFLWDIYYDTGIREHQETNSRLSQFCQHASRWRFETKNLRSIVRYRCYCCNFRKTWEQPRNTSVILLYLQTEVKIRAPLEYEAGVPTVQKQRSEFDGKLIHRLTAVSVCRLIMIKSVCKDSEGDDFGWPQDSIHILWVESRHVFLQMSGKAAGGCQCCRWPDSEQAGRQVFPANGN